MRLATARSADSGGNLSGSKEETDRGTKREATRRMQMKAKEIGGRVGM
jgi:hypothetical protein